MFFASLQLQLVGDCSRAFRNVIRTLTSGCPPACVVVGSAEKEVIGVSASAALPERPKRAPERDGDHPASAPSRRRVRPPCPPGPALIERELTAHNHLPPPAICDARFLCVSALWVDFL